MVGHSKWQTYLKITNNNIKMQRQRNASDTAQPMYKTIDNDSSSSVDP